MSSQTPPPAGSSAGTSAVQGAPAPVPPPPPQPQPVTLDAEHREFVWKVHEYTNEFIRFADAKAGVAIVFCGALLSGLYSARLHRPLLSRPIGAWHVGDVLAAAAFVLLALGTLAAVVAIRPRLHNPQPKGFIFWDSIRAHPNGDAFADAVATEPMDGLGRHLAAHLHVIAGIASEKYGWAHASIFMAIIGGVCAVAALLLG